VLLILSCSNNNESTQPFKTNAVFLVRRESGFTYVTNWNTLEKCRISSEQTWTQIE